MIKFKFVSRLREGFYKLTVKNSLLILVIILVGIIILYFQLELYFIKMFLSFVVFHFIFNKFKYSTNTIIRFIQKFIVYYICVYLAYFFFSSINLLDPIYSDPDKGASTENENRKYNNSPESKSSDNSNSSGSDNSNSSGSSPEGGCSK